MMYSLLPVIAGNSLFFIFLFFLYGFVFDLFTFGSDQDSEILCKLLPRSFR